MKKLLTLILITLSFSIIAQNKYYNKAVNSCEGTSSAELIECIKGSTLLNYDFTDINGKTISTDKIKKPILLAVVSTRVAPFWSGMPALSKIAEKNHDKMQIIFIFTDNEEKVKKIASKIDEHILLVAPKEGDKIEAGNIDISGFVHKLKDSPAGYLIGQNKEILAVVRGSAVPSKTMNLQQAIEANLANFKKSFTPLLGVVN